MSKYLIPMLIGVLLVGFATYLVYVDEVALSIGIFFMGVASYLYGIRKWYDQ